MTVYLYNVNHIDINTMALYLYKYTMLTLIR